MANKNSKVANGNGKSYVADQTAIRTALTAWAEKYHGGKSVADALVAYGKAREAGTTRKGGKNRTWYTSYKNLVRANRVENDHEELGITGSNRVFSYRRPRAEKKAAKKAVKANGAVAKKDNGKAARKSGKKKNSSKSKTKATRRASTASSGKSAARANA